MALVLAIGEAREFYLGTERVEITLASSAASGDDSRRVFLHTVDGTYEIVRDRMTEIRPCVLVALARRGRSLVIEAPSSLRVKLTASTGEPEHVPGWREVRFSDLSLTQLGDLGLSRTRVREMARLGVPAGGSRWTRRFEEYRMRVDGDLLVEVERAPVETTADGLVAFLYVLARDHLPVGTIEMLLRDHVEKMNGQTPVFSSPHLEALAREWARRL